MPFKPGQPKKGGRIKGTPNKKTLDLVAQCEQMNVDVFGELLKYLIFPCEPEMRLQAIKIAMPYLHAQRKAVEVTGSIEGITINVHDYTTKK